jgi:hypothetical protein
MPALAPIPQMEMMRGGHGQYGTAGPGYPARGHLSPLLSPNETQAGSGPTKSMDTISSPAKQPLESEPASTSGRKRSRKVTFGEEGSNKNLREAWPVSHGMPNDGSHPTSADMVTGGMHMYPQYPGMGPQQGQMQLTSAYIPAANGMLVQVPVYQPIGMPGYSHYTLPMGEGGAPGGMQLPFGHGFNFPFMPMPPGYDATGPRKGTGKGKPRSGASADDSEGTSGYAKKAKRQPKGSGKPRGRPADASRPTKQSSSKAATSANPEDASGVVPLPPAPFGGLLGSGGDSSANLMERVHANISASGIIFMKRKDCPRRAQKIKEAVHIGWQGLSGAEGEGGVTSDSDFVGPGASAAPASEALKEEMPPASRGSSEDEDVAVAKPVQRVKRPSYKPRKPANRSKPEAEAAEVPYTYQHQYQHPYQQPTQMWEAEQESAAIDGTFEAVAMHQVVPSHPIADSGDMSAVWADL